MVKYHFQIFVLLFLCLSVILKANEDTPDDKGVVYYSMSIHAGSMMPHYPLQASLNNDYIRGLDFSTYFLNSSKAELNHSALGLGYFMSNLGNNRVYGYVHSTYLSMLFPLLVNRFPVQLKLGLGPGYVTKKYDSEANTLNRAIGSHINAYGQISLTGGLPIAGEGWMLRMGMSFNHISNGLIFAPNQGINTVTLHAGLDFGSNHRHSGAFTIGRDSERKEKNRFTLTLASGVKEVDERAGKQILTSSLIFDYGYRFHPSFNAGVGINLFYNDTWAYLPYRMDYMELPTPFQSSIHLALELDKNPIAIILQPGFYIYRPTDVIPDFTGRLGMRYSFRNNITLQFAIKHHWFALADYFEWGIGYRFYR